MIKSIFRETIIMALLSVATLLILCVIFYGYIPRNKILPNKIAYQTPENISKEINEEIVNQSSQVNITYELDESAISLSKKIGDYKAGKQNPFEAYSPETQNVTANTSTNSSIQNTNVENSSNTSGYLPNKGTK